MGTSPLLTGCWRKIPLILAIGFATLIHEVVAGRRSVLDEGEGVLGVTPHAVELDAPAYLTLALGIVGDGDYVYFQFQDGFDCTARTDEEKRIISAEHSKTDLATLWLTSFLETGQYKMCFFSMAKRAEGVVTYGNSFSITVRTVYKLWPRVGFINEGFEINVDGGPRPGIAHKAGDVLGFVPKGSLDDVEDGDGEEAISSCQYLAELCPRLCERETPSMVTGDDCCMFSTTEGQEIFSEGRYGDLTPPIASTLNFVEGGEFELCYGYVDETGELPYVMAHYPDITVTIAIPELVDPIVSALSNQTVQFVSVFSDEGEIVGVRPGAMVGWVIRDPGHFRYPGGDGSECSGYMYEQEVLDDELRQFVYFVKQDMFEYYLCLDTHNNGAWQYIGTKLTVKAPAPVVESVSSMVGALNLETIMTNDGGDVITISGTFYRTSELSVKGESPRVTYGPQTGLEYECKDAAFQDMETIICTSQQGEGVNLIWIVSQEIADDAEPVVWGQYYPPRITSVSPRKAPTTGIIPITLEGFGFGLTQESLEEVLIGGQECRDPTLVESNKVLTCTLRPGSGAGLDIVIRSWGSVGHLDKGFSYDKPVIEKVLTPSIGREPGNRIILSGRNFGVTTESIYEVLVGGVACEGVKMALPQEEIWCRSPKLIGTSVGLVDVSVSIGIGWIGDIDMEETWPTVLGKDNASDWCGQYHQHEQANCTQTANLSGALTVRLPNITTVTPNPVPSYGGLVEINGTDLGFSESSFEKIMFGSFECSNITVEVPNESILCKIPPGGGTDLPLEIFVDDVSSLPFSISFATPTVSQVIPAVGSREVASQVTVVGSSFGDDASAITIMLGSTPCVNVSLLVPFTTLTCVTNSSTGSDLEVVVTVADYVSVGGDGLFDFVQGCLSVPEAYDRRGQNPPFSLVEPEILGISVSMLILVTVLMAIFCTLSMMVFTPPISQYTEVELLDRDLEKYTGLREEVKSKQRVFLRVRDKGAFSLFRVIELIQVLVLTTGLHGMCLSDPERLLDPLGWLVPGWGLLWAWPLKGGSNVAWMASRGVVVGWTENEKMISSVLTVMVGAGAWMLALHSCRKLLAAARHIEWTTWSPQYQNRNSKLAVKTALSRKTVNVTSGETGSGDASSVASDVGAINADATASKLAAPHGFMLVPWHLIQRMKKANMSISETVRRAASVQDQHDVRGSSPPSRSSSFVGVSPVGETNSPLPTVSQRSILPPLATPQLQQTLQPATPVSGTALSIPRAPSTASTVILPPLRRTQAEIPASSTVSPPVVLSTGEEWPTTPAELSRANSSRLNDSDLRRFAQNLPQLANTPMPSRHLSYSSPPFLNPEEAKEGWEDLDPNDIIRKPYNPNDEIPEPDMEADMPSDMTGMQSSVLEKLKAARKGVNFVSKKEIHVNPYSGQESTFSPSIAAVPSQRKRDLVPHSIVSCGIRICALVWPGTLASTVTFFARIVDNSQDELFAGAVFLALVSMIFLVGYAWLAFTITRQYRLDETHKFYRHRLLTTSLLWKDVKSRDKSMLVQCLWMLEKTLFAVGVASNKKDSLAGPLIFVGTAALVMTLELAIRPFRNHALLAQSFLPRLTLLTWCSLLLAGDLEDGVDGTPAVILLYGCALAALVLQMKSVWTIWNSKFDPWVRTTTTIIPRGLDKLNEYQLRAGGQTRAKKSLRTQNVPPPPNEVGPDTLPNNTPRVWHSPDSDEDREQE